MPSRWKPHALMLLGVAVAAGLISAGPPLGVDYTGPSTIGKNAAGPSLEALVRGDLHEFFAQQPMMGGFSLFLRAPFVALVSLFDGKLLHEYRAGAFPCVLALGVLGLVLAGRVQGERPWAARLVVVGLVLAGPMTFKSLFWGHPEELLAAALAVGAVIAAPRRATLAAVMLGCAIATKQWALVAIVPVLVAALPDRRLRLLLLAGAVAVLWTAPMAIGDLGRFLDQSHAAGHAGAGVTPSSLWWQFGDVVSVQPGLEGGEVRDYAIPMWMTKAAEPFTMAVAAALSILFWRRRRRYCVADALTLLALLMLLRCILDPMTISYHHAPFYTALAAAGVLRTRGIPLLTVAVAGALMATSQLALSPDLLNGVYLAWSLPLAVGLGLSLFAPRLLEATGLQRAPATG
jgi:glycosyl transferase family 87